MHQPHFMKPRYLIAGILGAATVAALVIASCIGGSPAHGQATTADIGSPVHSVTQR